MRAAILLNHELTEEQQSELRTRYGAAEIALPTQTVQRSWGEVEPDGDPPLGQYRGALVWLKSTTNPGDIVVVQGEFGAVVFVVTWCLEHGRRPLYATTRREVVEERHEGTTVSRRVFRHVRFREYVRWQDSRTGHACL